MGKKNISKNRRNQAAIGKSLSLPALPSTGKHAKTNGVAVAKEVNNNSPVPGSKWSWTAKENRGPVQQIFSYLGFEDKRKTSLVSKAWKKLTTELGHGAVLSIKNCAIDRAVAPLSLLRNSSTKFHNLSFGSDVHWQDVTEANRLAKFIGFGVEHINFVAFGTHSNKPAIQGILRSFKHLKSVHVQNISEAIFLDVPETVHSVHVEEFHNVMQTSQCKVVQAWKGKKKLTASRFINNASIMDMKQHAMFGHLSRNLQELMDQMKTTEFETNVDLFSVDVLDVGHVTAIEHKFVLWNRDTVKGIFLGCTALTKVVIQVDRGTGCFFYHETVTQLACVREICLVLAAGSAHRSICAECLAQLHKTCPNTDTWSINGKIKNYKDVIAGATKPIRALEILNVDDRVTLKPGFESHLESLTIQPFSTYLPFDLLFDLGACNWAPLPKLRTLCVGDGVQFNLATMEKFTKNCPNVQEFRIKGNLHMPEYLSVLAKAWPKLERIEACFTFTDHEQLALDAFGPDCKIVHRLKAM